MAYIFFDSNVMGPAIHKNHARFQENLSRLIPDKRNQRLLTPFSLYEFCGYNLENLNIQYKGKNLNEHLFKTCEEFDSSHLVEHIKNQICEKITKSDLKDKLERKKSCVKKFINIPSFFYRVSKKNPGFRAFLKIFNRNICGLLNNYTKEGKRIIENHIEKIDLMYDDLIQNLLFDRLSSQINIPTEEEFTKVRSKFIELYTVLVMSWIRQKRIFGSFRMVNKLYSELRNLPVQNKEKENPKFFKTHKEISKIVKGLNLKSEKDLVDCELIHLAFFGWRNDVCHIYTCEREKVIKERLKYYCVFVNAIISLIFDHKIYYDFIKCNDKELFDDIKNNKKPEWKLGKVLILNQHTGEKVTEISAWKIYEQVNKKIQKKQDQNSKESL